jgi:hypothetical protein
VISRINDPVALSPFPAASGDLTYTTASVISAAVIMTTVDVSIDLLNTIENGFGGGIGNCVRT